MASQKQELIQLHQLLGEIRYFAKNELDLNAEIKDLKAYKNIGVTSINLNVDIETQTDAILALATELSMVFDNAFETETTETESVENTETDTTSIPSETIATNLYQVTSDGINMEAVVANQPEEPKTQTTTAETTSNSYDTSESTPVVMSKTSLTDFVPEPEKRTTQQNHVTRPEETTTSSESLEQIELPAA